MLGSWNIMAFVHDGHWPLIIYSFSFKINNEDVFPKLRLKSWVCGLVVFMYFLTPRLQESHENVGGREGKRENTSQRRRDGRRSHRGERNRNPSQIQANRSSKSLWGDRVSELNVSSLLERPFNSKLTHPSAHLAIHHWKTLNLKLYSLYTKQLLYWTHLIMYN